MRMLYYFDVISPYSALSWHVLRRYRPRWNFELTLKPMFLGGVMMGSGNKPPAMQAANKGAWLPQDLARASAHFGVPMLPSPSNFFSEVARNVIKCQRLLCAAQALCDPATVEGLVTALTDAIHSDASFRDVDNTLAIDEAFLRACCEKVPTVPDVDTMIIRHFLRAANRTMLSVPSTLVS